jgi:hypothetical protein
MERGRLRWERCACGVLANRGADPRNPGRGSVARAGTAETTTGAARPRSLAPASGAVRPPGRWLGAIAGAARRARRTSHHPHVRPRQPPGGPGTARHQLAAPGRPGEATPGGAGRRGWGRECGSRATTPTSWRGWGRERGSRATTPTSCCATVPRWCCGSAPTWCWDANPTWCCSAATAGARPARAGVRLRRSSCACSRRVGPAVAWAGSLPDPRPEREAAADHPVPDAARVGALPGGAAHAPAVKADAAQVGLTAPARSDGGGGEPPGAHGSPSPLAVPCGLCPSPAAARGARASA